MGVNRFDRVISVQGWNDDGTALAETLDLTNQTYTDAVETILASETIEALMAQNAVVEIGVIGEDDAHCAQMLAAVESCTAGQQNAHCYQASPTRWHKPMTVDCPTANTGPIRPWRRWTPPSRPKRCRA